MKFTFAHNNFNVVDLEKSLKFYEEALNLHEVRRKEAADGSFILVWRRDWEKESYNLGDNEFHLAFETDDMDASLKKHREMDCVCYENPSMGIYFISDPDGYWLEIVPAK